MSRLAPKVIGWPRRPITDEAPPQINETRYIVKKLDTFAQVSLLTQAKPAMVELPMTYRLSKA
jgi:hypothetical protein